MKEFLDKKKFIEYLEYREKTFEHWVKSIEEVLFFTNGIYYADQVSGLAAKIRGLNFDLEVILSKFVLTNSVSNETKKEALQIYQQIENLSNQLKEVVETSQSNLYNIIEGQSDI